MLLLCILAHFCFLVNDSGKPRNCKIHHQYHTTNINQLGGTPATTLAERMRFISNGAEDSESDENKDGNKKDENVEIIQDRNSNAKLVKKNKRISFYEELSIYFVLFVFYTVFLFNSITL